MEGSSWVRIICLAAIQANNHLSCVQLTGMQETMAGRMARWEHCFPEMINGPCAYLLCLSRTLEASSQSVVLKSEITRGGQEKQRGEHRHVQLLQAALLSINAHPC